MHAVENSKSVTRVNGRFIRDSLARTILHDRAQGDAVRQGRRSPPHYVIVLGRTDSTGINTRPRIDSNHLHGARTGRLLSVRLLERRHHDAVSPRGQRAAAVVILAIPLDLRSSYPLST